MGDSDSISETTWVAAVTRPRSGPDQLEDLLRRLLMAVDPPAPKPEVPPRREVVTAASDRVTKSAIAGRQSSGVGGIRADAAVVPLWTAADAAAPRQRPIRRDWNGVVFLMWEVWSCCDSLPELE